MVYHGVIHGNAVVLSEAVELPEGTPVSVTIAVDSTEKALSPTLRMRNGIPVFPKQSDSIAPMTMEEVNAIRDAAP